MVKTDDKKGRREINRTHITERKRRSTKRHQLKNKSGFFHTRRSDHQQERRPTAQSHANRNTDRTHTDSKAKTHRTLSPRSPAADPAVSCKTTAETAPSASAASPAGSRAPRPEILRPLAGVPELKAETRPSRPPIAANLPQRSSARRGNVKRNARRRAEQE